MISAGIPRKRPEARVAKSGLRNVENKTATAAESKFEDVLPEFNRLQHQFEAIKEMHDRAKGTMDMTDRMLMQKLMG